MNQVLASGTLRKMKTKLAQPVEYRLPIGDEQIDLNALVGNPVKLLFHGEINCIHCGRETKKSFNQGYCFPCFKSLAECDMCIMRPETCHFHLGTCRDSEWAMNHCMQSHYVYIANSSGLKVGITRGSQIPTRWIDQGALQALPVFRIRNRYHSGLLEATIKKYVSDRTDWRKMLKGGGEMVDLKQKADEIIDQAKSDIQSITAEGDQLEWEVLEEPVVEIEYPVLAHPQKVTSFNIDKTPEISGILNGIKGQYLILDTGVINIRKFAGYQISLSA
ncbi:MAG: DUF2797 domain-containing protein [Gammaproteobacteria bacterium]|jgi:hypothetical protein